MVVVDAVAWLIRIRVDQWAFAIETVIFACVGKPSNWQIDKLSRNQSVYVYKQEMVVSAGFK